MAEEVFRPDEEIPAWFWEVVDRVGGDENLLEEALAELRSSTTSPGGRLTARPTATGRTTW